MDPRAVLLANMSESELESAVQNKIDEFHGFLTREAAIKLIAAEKGMLKKEIKKIADISSGAKNISITGAVIGITPINQYPSGNRSRKIEVKDESGKMNLLLWNDDADSAAGIKSNDEIEIANAYEKDNELRLGYSGYFRIRKRSGFTQLAELSGNKEWEGKRIHVKSFISRITGNAEGVFRFFISDGAAELECALAANDERCPHFKQGREIAIESGLVENGKIRIDWKTRVLLKRESVITGTLEEIKEVEDKENEAAGEKEGVDKAGKVEIVVSGKTILLEKDAVYKLLGVKPVDGIALSTIINLKKDTMLNKKVVIEI